MATHAWTIVCRRAIVNMFDNSLSLIDQIESVAVPTPPAPPVDNPKALPAVPVDWTIITLWRRTDRSRPERINVRCKVLAPDGKSVVELVQELHLDKLPNMRGLMQLAFLPLRGPGTYQFVVYVGRDKAWRRVTSVPVEVQYIEGAPAPSAAPAPKKKRTH